MTYVTECLRLLYWIYFKPFTFKRWLQDILQNINITLESKHTFMGIHPGWMMLWGFHIYPPLRHYARQFWWLTAVTPILAVLLVAPVYTFFSGESFNWFHSGQVWLGWFIGQTAARNDNRILQILNLCLWVVIVGLLWIFVGWNIFADVAPETMQALLKAFPVITNLVSTLEQLMGLTLGVIYSVLVGVAFSVGNCLALGVFLTVTAGMVGAVAFSVTCGVVGGIAVSVMFFGVGEYVAGNILAFIMFSMMAIMPGSMSGWLVGLAGGLAFILGILRVYFWLPEVLWMFILRFFSLQKNRVLLLRYLPPYFDELIYFPLPFMAEIIVEAYQEKPKIARETIDYLSTHINQKRVIASAMVGIAISRLKSCKTFSDIANIIEEFAWIPSPAPKQLGSVFPKLLDISQDVGAARKASSVSRKYELLTRPITALQKLKNSLAFSKNRGEATTFGNIIQTWLGILETAQRNLEAQERFSIEIPQVYIAGNALDPETAKNRFKGRMDLFQEIETLAMAESPPVLLLYGGRKTGKTSSLKYIPHKVGANLIPLLVGLQGGTSARTLEGLAKNLVSQIQEAARRLPRKIDLPEPQSQSLEKDPFIALQNWFAQIESKFPSKRFLLCLDEYERLSELVDATNSKIPLNFLRHLIEHRTAWTLLFSGANQPSELPDYWSDYLINTRTVRISYLQESEARELIVQPVEGFRHIYEPEAVDEIIRLTHCQPYLVQLMCYEIVELLNRETRANRRDADTVTATAQDIEAVIPIILERGDQYFRELWTSLTDSDRNLLWRVSQNEAPTSADSRIIRKLVRKEILLQEREYCYFQVPLIKEYLEYLYLAGEEI
ncbi:MAG: AAA family ATPase [Calothrix sp. MO_192.B10]|nr:AAA family ATPase [Calothrix sp. MO_192.B10]